MNYQMNPLFILTCVTLLSCSSMNKDEISTIEGSRPSLTVLVNGAEIEKIYFNPKNQLYSAISLASNDSLVIKLDEKTCELFSFENGHYANVSDLPIGRVIIDDIVSSDKRLSLETILLWTDIRDREKIFMSTLTVGREVDGMIQRTQSSDTIFTSISGINNTFNHFQSESFTNFVGKKLINYNSVSLNGVLRKERYEFENGSILKEYSYINSHLSGVKSTIRGEHTNIYDKTFVYH